MTFRIAHISDVHIGPLPPVKLSEMLSKRIVGYNSWMFRRRAVHDPKIASEIVRDIKAAHPKHIMVTGDLVNIALQREFINGEKWLRNLGNPDLVSFVPGNHDAYVRIPWERGMGRLGDYMTGDLTVPGAIMTSDIAMPFPYVRQRRNIAMIGVSTAISTMPGRATGALGVAQLEALSKTLSNLRTKGFYRILMIHHPPLPGLARRRKALTDAKRLKDILDDEGCDLVVHGHNHTTMHNTLSSRYGPVHILGVPSATSNGRHNTERAAWNEYHIRRASGRWQCTVSTRCWDVEKCSFVTQTGYSLD